MYKTSHEKDSRYLSYIAEDTNVHSKKRHFTLLNVYIVIIVSTDDWQ